MKNIILGIIGVFITIYTVLIGLNVLSFQTQKNELEKYVSRIVKNTLEAEYQKGDEALVRQLLLEELNASVSTRNGRIEVDIQALDLQKGILSIRVTKWVEMINGREKEIVVEKTAIMDRVYMHGT